MDILSEVTELKQANATLAADGKAASELLESATAELNTFKAEAAVDKATATSQLEQINELTSKLAASGSELNSVKTELETLKASQKSAEQRAVEIVASQGVAPIPVKAGASEQLSNEDALAKYNALHAAGKSVEAGKFWTAHKALNNKK